MKSRVSKLILPGILSLIFFQHLIFSQVNNQNQITIRSDRVFILNGKPFFPIGMCFENQTLYYQLRDNGFNFIDLFSNNHFLYSDSCGFNSRNVISGDPTTNSQYRELMELYAPNFRWEENAHRIFNYIGNDNMYILGEDYPFYPDDIADYILNNGSCGDSVIFTQNFNQNIRNESVNRVVSISHWPGNKLIGNYAKDDANMFAINGPYPTYFYDNYFNTRVLNYKNTYDEFKKGYPNSLVLMSIPNTYFPRAVDPRNWQNVDTAREYWIRDAILLSQGADALFCPGYLTYEGYSDPFMIYNNKYPSIYQYDLEKTVFDRVLPSNKAVLGGLIFDILESLPDTNDTHAFDKIKWHIYIGLEKGCTGLIFYGWQKYARPEAISQIKVWDKIRIIVNEMVNVLHLNEKVFINTNSGQVGHAVSGTTSDNVSYCVYKINGWKDYYLLVTNNPNGSLFTTEPDNMVKLSASDSAIDWKTSRITEVFSNQDIVLQPDKSIQLNMSCYKTALFHVYPNQIPLNFRLYQNYPNPFNPKTKIKFDIPNPGEGIDGTSTVLKVYDILGRESATIVNAVLQPGSYEYEFDASKLSSGVYFYRIEAGLFSGVKKMMVVK